MGGRDGRLVVILTNYDARLGFCCWGCDRCNWHNISQDFLILTQSASSWRRYGVKLAHIVYGLWPPSMRMHRPFNIFDVITYATLIKYEPVNCPIKSEDLHASRIDPQLTYWFLSVLSDLRIYRINT